MSVSDKRNRRCLRAIAQALEHQRRDGSARKDVEHLLHRFLSARGIFDGCLNGMNDDLLSEPEAELLSLIPSLARYAHREQFGRHPMIADLNDACEYLNKLFIGVSVEHFYLLCLDASGRLIECRLLQKGTIDQAAFYITHLLQSVIATDARAVVLCHNHPGGTPRPSTADIDCTLNTLRALYPLRVSLLDHIIIAGQEGVSMRRYGFIAADLWLRQDPESSLLRGWLSKDDSF